MKIAIVTDSNSGITQKQAQELGVFVLAMPFQIDGETYYEDITLTQEEFYKKLREGGNISTSQPSPGSVTDLWDKILQEYDQIVHIPMSSGLSGSCQTAIMLALCVVPTSVCITCPTLSPVLQSASGTLLPVLLKLPALLLHLPA